MSDPHQTSPFRLDTLLISCDGSRHPTADPSRRCPLLLAFYKATCPTCRLTMPFLERLYRRLEPGVLEIWAVAQEMPDTAAAYADQLGLTFPQMVDPDLEATEALDLNHVPSLFLLNPDGTILRHMTGFHRGWLEEIASEFSPHAGPLFAPDENVPPMKPG